MAFGLLEDGGEMVVSSLVVAYVVRLVSGGPPLARARALRGGGLSAPG